MQTTTTNTLLFPLLHCSSAPPCCSSFLFLRCLSTTKLPSRGRRSSRTHGTTEQTMQEEEKVPQQPHPTSKMDSGPPLPVFSRPFINLASPSDTSTPAWMAPQQLKYSKVLFAKPIAAHPVLVAQTIHNMPKSGIPQVAFVGKSNVGKSSLINALMYGKQVARTSATPGRTRHLFTFDLGDHLSLIDLPGYGGAKVSKELRMEWAVLIEEYFNNSKLLERVVSLVDCEEGPTALDMKLWDMLLEKQLQFQVVLTKVDRLGPLELHGAVARLMGLLQPYSPSPAWTFVHCVSSRQHLGISELRASLAAIAADGRRKAGKRLLKHSEGGSSVRGA
eukprot:GHVS01067610.1.p1 GENE.GHVS01067610.1~~GHVS01067610.1.p1  ORF type:complete len:333 (+),score=40.84 GHVS01067610.1:82-1080(+)